MSRHMMPSKTPAAGASAAGSPQAQVQAQNQQLDALTLADAFVRSGFFTDIKEQAQALVKILYGRELGIGPVTAMMQIHIIGGKPAPSAGLMAALIKRSGRYDYRVLYLGDDGCEIQFIEGGEAVGTARFTKADADRIGVWSGRNGHTWRAYPRNMMFARALSNGMRMYCPDLFLGPVYTAEELDARVDDEGNVVEMPVSSLSQLAGQHKERWAYAEEINQHLWRLGLSRAERLGLIVAMTGRQPEDLDTPALREVARKVGQFTDREAVLTFVQQASQQGEDEETPDLSGIGIGIGTGTGTETGNHRGTEGTEGTEGTGD